MTIELALWIVAVVMIISFIGCIIIAIQTKQEEIDREAERKYINYKIKNND